MGRLLRGMLVPHAPGFLDPAAGVPASVALVRRLEALGAEVARLRPDALVVASAHWVTTFHHYVAGPRRLTGVLTATEAPDRVRTFAYDFPGDPELARALVAAGTAARIPAVLTEEPTVPWDHRTVVPLRYLTPAADVPIVPLSLCQLADLAETLRWGRAIGRAVRAGSRRVILVLTGALASPPAPRPSGRAGPDGVAPTAPGGRPGGRAPAAGRHLGLLLGALGAGDAEQALGVGPGAGGAVLTLAPK